MQNIKKLFTASILLFLAGTASAGSFTGKDNCTYRDKSLLNRVPGGELVVVVDQSEALSISHKDQVTELVSKLLIDESVAPVGTHISIFTFGKNDFKQNGDGQSIKPIVSVCRPKNSANPLYQNARKINHQFEARYLKPVQSAIEGAANGSLGERSPIMEMIQYISSHTSLNAEDNPGTKRLVLVSDLLQHSESYSSYSNRSYGVPNGLLSNLKGWNVNVLAPKRYGSDQSLQTGENIKMWNSLFKASGASSINIKFLP
jgi:hypothetical protein